ncbi:MAG: hypothetical protein DHS20C01_33130 [marine bacterium B5-7]|nr:MAG: hypothetical protein DHS20C01_33130 [marine bacterium B5-7]
MRKYSLDGIDNLNDVFKICDIATDLCKANRYLLTLTTDWARAYVCTCNRLWTTAEIGDARLSNTG